MESYRTQIDALDEQLIGLLAQRFVVAGHIGAFKQAQGLAVYDAKREAEVLHRLQAIAQAQGLDPQFCAQLYTLIFEHSRALQAQGKIKNKGGESS